MPKKPTKPFVQIEIDNRRITESKVQLPADKREQEREVMKRFIDRHNIPDHPANIVMIDDDLPENDHDFVVKQCDAEIDVQLVELVDREYYRKCDPDNMDTNLLVVHHFETGEVWCIDVDARDKALTNIVIGKQKRNYSQTPGRPLWLVVFSVSYYAISNTEYSDDGYDMLVSPSRAVKDLTDQLANKHVVFDEIWFTDLRTPPTVLFERASCTSDFPRLSLPQAGS